VIAAAGSGERPGAGGPKALVELAGRPLVAWCFDAIAAAEHVARAVIAGPPGRETELAAAAEAAGHALELEVVTGGASRVESVAAALAHVDSDLVAVHDAARPLVSAELVDGVLAKLAARPEVAGVIAATPIVDTVKRTYEPRRPGDARAADAPVIAGTESREHLWAAQTPQAFRTESLLDAHAVPSERLAAATDDSMLVEEGGGRVLIHPSPPGNIKVTTPVDLRIAELLLANRDAGRR
jgi:2-C-methyl-D-erythritol 4-phosphate cytidylyltransferase